MRHCIMEEDSVLRFTAIHYTFTGGGCSIHVLFNRCSVALSAVQWGTNTAIITKADRGCGEWISKIILFPSQLKKKRDAQVLFSPEDLRQNGLRCLESLEKQNTAYYKPYCIMSLCVVIRHRADNRPNLTTFYCCIAKGAAVIHCRYCNASVASIPTPVTLVYPRTHWPDFRLGAK